jgi:hypothetical protein
VPYITFKLLRRYYMTFKIHTFAKYIPSILLDYRKRVFEVFSPPMKIKEAAVY